MPESVEAESYVWRALEVMEKKHLSGDNPPIRMVVLECDVCEAREPVFVLDIREPSGGRRRHLSCQLCREKFTVGTIDRTSR